MSSSFGRYCRLLVGSSDLVVTGTDAENSDYYALDFTGLRVQFEVVKSYVGTPNTARITIYNLSKSTRERLTTEFDRITLEAGYDDDNGVLFNGEIFNVFHERRQPDYASIIYASDGGFNFREAFTNVSYGAGVSLERVLTGLANDMQLNVGENLISGASELIFPSGWQFCGDTPKALDLLADSFSFNWSIQTGKLYIVPEGETLSRPKYSITSESGMIGSPTLTERGIDVQTLLNWQLTPNEEINVVSLGQTVNYQALNINYAQDRVVYGDFIARKITHRGDTRGNDWYSFIEGYRGATTDAVG